MMLKTWWGVSEENSQPTQQQYTKFHPMGDLVCSSTTVTREYYKVFQSWNCTLEDISKLLYVNIDRLVTFEF